MPAYTEIDVELIALGAVILNHRLIDTWKLRSTDFANNINQQCFEIVNDHYRRGEIISPMMLESHFDCDEFVTDEHTIRDQIREAVIVGNREATPGTGIRLRQIAGQYAVTNIADRLRAQGLNDVDPETALENVKVDIEAVVDRSAEEDEAIGIGDVGAQIVQDLMDGVVPELIPTGSVDLNKALSGLGRGEMIIVAGRPSMGKSMTGQSLGLKIAEKGHGVMMFSLEMNARELGYRALSDLSWTGTTKIPYQDIRTQDINDNQRKMIGEAAARFRSLPFIVNDTAGMSIDQISFEVRKQQRRMRRDGKSLDVVIVDHMGHVKPSDRYKGNKTNEVGEVSAGLLKMAKDLDIAVIALCQLNRGPEGREDKRPTLADLRNSGDIEQDANAVIFVYREYYYLERKADSDPVALNETRNVIDLLIAKSRNGPTGIVQLFCEPSCNVIRDFAK
jgi:replicative DNA helicase